MAGPRTPEELLSALLRYHTTAHGAVTEALPDPRQRAITVAALTYRHHHPRNAPPSPWLLTSLGDAWCDTRVRALLPPRRAVLLSVTGGALALEEARDPMARALLGLALAASRKVWAPDGWHPWLGAQEAPLTGRPLATLPLAPASPDPTGDPEPPAAPRPTGETWAPSWGPTGDLDAPRRLSQILDGLDTWEAVIQDHLNLALGEMRRQGVPDLSRLAADPWRRAIPADVLDQFGRLR